MSLYFLPLSIFFTALARPGRSGRPGQLARRLYGGRRLPGERDGVWVAWQAQKCRILQAFGAARQLNKHATGLVI